METITMRSWQSMVIEETMDEIRRGTKGIVWSLQTSFGKSFMVLEMAKRAKLQGTRVIYLCNTKQSIREIIELCKKYESGLTESDIVYVPSDEDAWRILFSSECNFNINDIYDPFEGNDDERNFHAEQLRKCINHITAIESPEEIVNKVIKQLKRLCSRDTDELVKEEARRQFNEETRKIKKKFLDWIRKNYRGDFKEALKDFPALGYIYPGARVVTSRLIVMTSKKSAFPLNPLSNDPNESVIRPNPNGELAKSWVFIDECDKYPKELLDIRIKQTIKNHIDQFTLVNELLDFIRGMRNIPGKKILQDDERVKKNKIELFECADEFVERFGDIANATVKYASEKDRLIIYQSGSKTDIISGDGKRESSHSDYHIWKYEEEGAYTVSLNQISGYTKLNYTLNEVLGEISSLTNKFIRLVRSIFDVERKNNLRGASTNNLIWIALEDIGIRYETDSLVGEFISDNLYNHSKKSIGENQLFYKVGFNYITTEENDMHPDRTSFHTYKLGQLPEYNLARMLQDYSFIIFSSASAGIKSFSSPDFDYLIESVGESLSDEGINVLPIKVKLDCLEECGKMLEEQRKDRYQDTQVNVSVYRRKKTTNDYINSIREIIGNKLEPLKFISESNDTNLGYLYDFALWAAEQSLTKQIPVSFIYQTRGMTIGDNGEYCLDRINNLIKKIAIKKGIDKPEEHVHIEAVTSNDIDRVVNDLAEKGIEDNNYRIYFTTYQSAGAGTNFYWKKKGTEEIYNIGAIYLGDLTHIITHENEKTEYRDKIAGRLETIYKVGKASIMTKGYPFVTKYIKTYINSNGHRNTDPYINDTLSPYKGEVRKMFLQAVNRLDRGNLNGKDIIVGFSETFLKQGINRTVYNNVQTGVLLNKVIDWLENEYSTTHFITELESEYYRCNQYNLQMVQDLLKKIYDTKTIRQEVPERDKRKNSLIRNAAFSMGYVKESNVFDEMYFINDKINNSKNIYWDKAGERVEEDDRNRLSTACIYEHDDNCPSTKCILYRPQDELGNFIMDILDSYEENNCFGKGWKKLFETLRDNEDDIRANGFKYTPYAETVFIFLGIFWEKVFEAMTLPGGCLQEIGKLGIEPMPNNMYEDADYKIKGTNVFIDIKGFTADGIKWSTENKLTEKMSHSKEKCCFIGINVCPVKGESPKFIDETLNIGENKALTIHGITSFAQLENNSADIITVATSVCERIKMLAMEFREG